MKSQMKAESIHETRPDVLGRTETLQFWTSFFIRKIQKRSERNDKPYTSQTSWCKTTQRSRTCFNVKAGRRNRFIEQKDINYSSVLQSSSLCLSHVSVKQRTIKPEKTCEITSPNFKTATTKLLMHFLLESSGVYFSLEEPILNRISGTRFWTSQLGGAFYPLTNVKRSFLQMNGKLMRRGGVRLWYVRDASSYTQSRA